jgi:hypothetical protein
MVWSAEEDEQVRGNQFAARGGTAPSILHPLSSW